MNFLLHRKMEETPKLMKILNTQSEIITRRHLESASIRNDVISDKKYVGYFMHQWFAI